LKRRSNGSIRVEHLFISPGHNFLGHHGQPAGEHPIAAVEQSECVAGRGIRGDRFFDYKENYKGQITLFSMEVFDALRRELNLPKAHPLGGCRDPSRKRIAPRSLGPPAMQERRT
jgi:hypothetical protein